MAGEILSGVGSIIDGLAAGSGALGSVFSANQSWRRQKRAMDYQHKLAIEAYERELADSRDYSAIVDAANTAGINPLVALGQSASGGSISATSVPTEDSLPSTIANAGASIGSAINGMTNGALLMQKQLEAIDLENEGQKIDNAIQQKELDDKDRQLAHQRAMDDLAESKAKLDNDIADFDFDFKKATKEDQLALVRNLVTDSNTRLELLKNQLERDNIDTQTYEQQSKLAIATQFATLVTTYGDLYLKFANLELDTLKFKLEKLKRADDNRWRKVELQYNILSKFIDFANDERGRTWSTNERESSVREARRQKLIDDVVNQNDSDNWIGEIITPISNIGERFINFIAGDGLHTNEEKAYNKEFGDKDLTMWKTWF